MLDHKKRTEDEYRTVEDRIVVKYIHSQYVSYICLANYGASEAVYLCNGVVKIHQHFRPKMRQYI
jgi:hypothetical protein